MFILSKLTWAQSSTVIEDITKYCQENESYALAYFYFDFNDPKKQQSTYLLRSLLTQLSHKSPKCLDILLALRTKYDNGSKQPISADLLNTLKNVIGCFHHVYLAVDALDECSDQDDLLDALAKMANWKLDNLHVLATSRSERRIEDGLGPIVSEQVGLDSDLVDADIQIHLSAKLQIDARFKKWTAEERLEIKDTLITGAHGM